VPEGNVLEVPDGVSAEVARVAVLAGFKQRGWRITTDTPEKIAAVLDEKNKEAITTVTFAERSITLIPECFEKQADGQRTKIEPHLRWHNNLKESIIRELYKAEPETAPSAEKP
jgi:hypothetical protein